MANYSPYECDATTGAGSYYDFKGFPSPSPIPSPRGPGYYFDSSTPVRPAARAHFRGQSTSGFQNNYPSPRGPMFSPRYTISGEYATANVSLPQERACQHRILLIWTGRTLVRQRSRLRGSALRLRAQARLAHSPQLDVGAATTPNCPPLKFAQEAREGRDQPRRCRA